MSSPASQYDINKVHPLEVLQTIQVSQSCDEACALVVVTDTEGGGVRAPGALLAISEGGKCAGYVSNGCVDSDIVLQAQHAMREHEPRSVQYGLGSPYKDIQLPCGGGVSLLIIPNPNSELIDKAVHALNARLSISLLFKPSGIIELDKSRQSTGWKNKVFVAKLLPRLKIRIAGRGAEPIALAKLAHSSGFEVIAQSPHGNTLTAMAPFAAITQPLSTQDTLPQSTDDIWTAFVLLFHDHEWEAELLKQALNGKAFYIGAMGSPNTHAKRCELLKDFGIKPDAIDRIRAPIGLIPSQRDASVLSISTLAEIVETFGHLTKIKATK